MSDISHCTNETCIHRRGCLRWVGNYKNLPKYYATISNTQETCVKSSPPYKLLKRFRNSSINGFID